MKKKLINVFSLLMLLLLLSACALVFPGDELPGRGDPAYTPTNSVDFGTYGGNPISWCVLDNSDGNLLLISRYILTTEAYDDTDGTAWADSDMRAWLNGAFYDAAFTDVEKSTMLGTDKVTLLTQAQAENASYFGNDSVRVAYDLSYTAGEYWLQDDGGSAMYVTTTGLVTLTNATITSGVRPVIIVDGDAIAMLANSLPAMLDGQLINIQAPVFSDYNSVLWDDTLPTLSVSDYGVDEDGMLWIDCTVSAELSSDEKVYAYFASQSGGTDYTGWSSIVDGRLTYDYAMYTDSLYSYDVRLSVVKMVTGQPTYSAGPATNLSKPVQLLSIDGIKDGGSYLTGQALSFTAIGFGTAETSPTDGFVRWVPVSWSADAQSGTWSSAPYTGSLVFDTPGEYTLAVPFQRQVYDVNGGSWINDTSESGTQTRTVTFTVALPLELTVSPSDGIIYTSGRITITPNLADGTWDFDSDYLSQHGNSFTGLKAGTMTVTYTVGAQSKSVSVTIEESELPSTGQDFAWVRVLCGAALAVAGVGLLLRRRAKTSE